MLLLIDIGNTDIVICNSDFEKIKSCTRIKTRDNRTPDEYNILIRSLISCNEIKAVVISSVVPTVTNYFKITFNKYFNINPIIVESGIKTGISIKTSSPLEVGSDLICDALGYSDNYEGDGLIIDLGTASKYIYVSNRQFLGCIISPGVKTSLDALVNKTALLPEIDLLAPKKVLGNNTIECMQSGIMYGKAAEVDGLIRRIRKEIGKDLNVVATGGLAKLIIPLCEENITLDQNLLHKGLLSIFHKNRNLTNI